MADENKVVQVKLGDDQCESFSLVHELDKRDMMDINNAHTEGDLETRAGEKMQVQIDSVKFADDINNIHIKRRGKSRRGSKRNKPRKPRQKYKPYNTLTWEEKRKLGERDAEKAVRRRNQLVLQKGRAIAPYNTTQFLMEEHEKLKGPDYLSVIHQDHQNSNDNLEIENENGDSFSSSNSDDEYFDKDFNEFYEKVHIDTLNSYSKEDLIKTVYELERKIESLEKDAKVNRDTEVLIEENTRLNKEIKELKEKLT